MDRDMNSRDMDRDMMAGGILDLEDKADGGHSGDGHSGDGHSGDGHSGDGGGGISMEISELPDPAVLSEEIQQHLHQLRTAVPTFEDFCKDTHKRKPCEPCVSNNLVKSVNHTEPAPSSVLHTAPSVSVSVSVESAVASSVSGDADLLTFTKRREKLSHQLNAPKREFIGNMWGKRSSTMHLSRGKLMSSSINTKVMAPAPVRTMNGRMRLGFALH
jgi:hypothetical protein